MFVLGSWSSDEEWTERYQLVSPVTTIPAEVRESTDYGALIPCGTIAGCGEGELVILIARWTACVTILLS